MMVLDAHAVADLAEEVPTDAGAVPVRTAYFVDPVVLKF